jgi:hypothetical protein
MHLRAAEGVKLRRTGGDLGVHRIFTMGIQSTSKKIKCETEKVHNFIQDPTRQ